MVKWGRTPLHFHAEDRTFPRSEEELGQVHRIECRINLTKVLRLGDAGGKRRTPLLKDGLKPLAQELALRRGLNAEIADQTAAIPFVAGKTAADDLQVPLQAPTGCEGLIAKCASHSDLDVVEVAVENLLRKGFHERSLADLMQL